MKSKGRVCTLVSRKVTEGVRRADASVGSAIRAWLEEEIKRGDLVFSDIAMALHIVVSQEAASHALSRCSKGNEKSMKRQYSALAALCLDHHFDKLLEREDA